jgi:hypothetical protein
LIAIIGILSAGYSYTLRAQKFQKLRDFHLAQAIKCRELAVDMGRMEQIDTPTKEDVEAYNHANSTYPKYIEAANASGNLAQKDNWETFLNDCVRYYQDKVKMAAKKRASKELAIEWEKYHRILYRHYGKASRYPILSIRARLPAPPKPMSIGGYVLTEL